MKKLSNNTQKPKQSNRPRNKIPKQKQSTNTKQSNNTKTECQYKTEQQHKKLNQWRKKKTKGEGKGSVRENKGNFSRSVSQSFYFCFKKLGFITKPDPHQIQLKN